MATTSTENSGLLEAILPEFTAATGVEVHVVAMATGQALRAAANGDADLLMVHDEGAELQFIRQGYGIERIPFMYNDFILVGPGSDPAAIREVAQIKDAMSRLYEADATFISRSDESGTHKMELRLWAASGLEPNASGVLTYHETGAGMAKALNISASMDAYTLSDRGTWLSYARRGNLEVLFENDTELLNQYSLIVINADKHPHIKANLARTLANWLTSVQGQESIAHFKKMGVSLFTPNYNQGSR